MRKLLLVLIFIVISLHTAHSTDVNWNSTLIRIISSENLFASAILDNRIYRSIHSDYELSRMRALKAEIEARDTLDELAAQETALSAQIEYREQLEDFVQDVLDAAFVVKSAELNKETAGLRHLIAQERLKQNKARFNSGQIPQTDLTNTEVTLKTAELDVETAVWNLADVMEDFKQVTELSWQPELLPAEPEGDLQIMDLDAWIARDALVERAQLRLSLKMLQNESLPLNTPSFNRRLAEKEEEQAQLAYERAVLSSKRDFEQLRRRIYHEGEFMMLRRSELDVYEELVITAQHNVSQGLITLAEYYETQVQSLQAQNKAILALKNYYSALISYSIRTENVLPHMREAMIGEH